MASEGQWPPQHVKQALRIASLEVELEIAKAENARLREAFNNAPANADFATMDEFAAAYDEWWETYVTPALARKDSR